MITAPRSSPVEYIPQVVMNGLICGGSYALASLGFALIFGALRVVNLAHGSACVVGGYAGYAAVHSGGLPAWAGLPAAMAAGAVFGAVMERIAFRPFRANPSAALLPVVSSLACAMIVENLIAAGFGHEAKTVRADGTEQYVALGASVTGTQLQILLMSVLLVMGLYLLLNRTDFGRQTIATSDDPEAAASWGVNGDRISSATCMMGSALAAAAGYMIALDLGIDPYMGTELMFAAFTASLLFGFGSLPGAAAGGVVLGVLQNLVAAYLSTRYRSACTFLVLIAILVWKPNGMFFQASRRAGK